MFLVLQTYQYTLLFWMRFLCFRWQATNYSFLWGMTLDEGVQHRLGTKRPMQPVKQMTSMRVHINEVLPPEFDGREEWGDMIHPVMDQGDCGSSWAFSTTSKCISFFFLSLGTILPKQNLDVNM